MIFSIFIYLSAVCVPSAHCRPFAHLCVFILLCIPALPGTNYEVQAGLVLGAIMSCLLSTGMTDVYYQVQLFAHFKCGLFGLILLLSFLS